MSQTRTPATLRNSRFSVPERGRIRMALVTYMRRYGRTPDAVLVEMGEVLPENLQGIVNDRFLIRRFIRGSESDDDKISAFAKFIEIVDPDLSIGLSDDGFICSIGDALTSYYMPFENISGYERAIEFRQFAQLSGLYIDINSKLRGLNALTFLLIRSVGDAPYGRTDIFKLIPSQNSRLSAKIIEDEVKEITLQIRSFDKLENCAPYPDEHISKISALCDRLIYKLSDHGHYIECLTESSGILCHNSDIGYIFQRTHLRRSPATGKVDFISEMGFWADIIDLSELTISFLSSNKPKEQKNTKQTLHHFQKFESAILTYIASKIPWKFA